MELKNAVRSHVSVARMMVVLFDWNPEYVAGNIAYLLSYYLTVVARGNKNAYQYRVRSQLTSG
jgi:hypothetical protein